MGPRLFRRGNISIGAMFSAPQQRASMGPRLFRRGNVKPFVPTFYKIISFNGATSFQTWKLEGDILFSIGMVKLQWGHVFSDVEIADGAEVGRLRLVLLQWGHVFSDVEMFSVRRRCSRPFSGFNGATSFQTWKFLWSLNSISQAGYSFNGATSFQTWK